VTQVVNKLIPDLPPTPTGPPTLVADTGATATYISTNCPVLHPQLADKAIAIQNPNGDMMMSTHVGDLDLPMLRPAARRAHIVPALHDCSLLSIGTLCDAGYLVEFDAAQMRILDDGHCILTGHRDIPTGMWHVDLPPPKLHLANRIGDPKPPELVAYAHAAMFSPALATLEQALKKGFLINFPGLTATSLRNHPPISIPMAKGHLDQTRKNQRSTKSHPTAIPPDANDPIIIPDEFYPTPETHKTHNCFVAYMNPTGQIYSDQTGRFVAPSSNGNNYLMVLYDYDSNHIFAQPFKNRTAISILNAFKTIHRRLLLAGCRPLLHRLDNECSTILKEYLVDETIDFQLVPPGVHRRNAAERAIRTFQNHFIAGLCSVDKDFPIHLWDHLVGQAELTLNLMRGSRLNPKLSAHAQINGQFNYNRTPIGPPGCRVLAHVKTSDRTTWSPHGLDGWYVGPATESYRCWRIWIYETRAIRVCDTVAWFPTKVKMPNSSSNDMILAALQDIVHALQHPSPKSPIAPRTDSHVKALEHIVELLTNVSTEEDPLTPSLRVLPLDPPIISAESAPLLRVPTPTDSDSPPNIIPFFDSEDLPPVPTYPPTSPTPIPDDSAALPPPTVSPRLIVDSAPNSVRIPHLPQPIIPLPAASPTTSIPTVEPTYQAITGPSGKRRRQRQRKQHRALPRPVPCLPHNPPLPPAPASPPKPAALPAPALLPPPTHRGPGNVNFLRATDNYKFCTKRLHCFWQFGENGEIAILAR
jgi:hypothetical protein